MLNNIGFLGFNNVHHINIFIFLHGDYEDSKVV